jgi:hypothetical protein
MNEPEPGNPAPASAWIFPTLIHGVLGFVLFARLLVAGPRYRRLYEDYQLVLPRSTELFLALSVQVETFDFWLIFLLPVAGLLDGLVLWLLGGWATLEGRLFFWIGVGLLLGTGALMEASFFWPHYRLLRALSR